MTNVNKYTGEVRFNAGMINELYPFLGTVGFSESDKELLEAVNADYHIEWDFSEELNIELPMSFDADPVSLGMSDSLVGYIWDYNRDFAETLVQYILNKHNLMVITATSGYNYNELDYFRDGISDKLLTINLSKTGEFRDLFDDVWAFIVPRKNIRAYNHKTLDQMIKICS